MSLPLQQGQVYGMPMGVPMGAPLNVSVPALSPAAVPTTPSSLPSTPSVPSITPTHTKKRTSFTACSACQSKHCACDEHRPCNRCVRLGIACTEGVPRKGKSKKKPQKDRPSANESPASDSYAMLERELLASKRPSQFSTNTAPSAAATQQPNAAVPTPCDFTFDPIFESPFDLTQPPPSTPSPTISQESFTAALLNDAGIDVLTGPHQAPTVPMDPDLGITILGKESRSYPIGSFIQQMATAMHGPAAMKRGGGGSTMMATPTQVFTMETLSSSSSSSLLSSSSPHHSPKQTDDGSPTMLSSPGSSPVLPGDPSNYPALMSALAAAGAVYPAAAHSPSHYPTTHSAQSNDNNNAQNNYKNSNAPQESVTHLHEEISKLKQELAAVRSNQRRGFPMGPPVKPRDFGMCLWSLPEGLLLDFSAGFLSLLSFKNADNITFDLISPPETRMQRRHLRAFFVCERPDISGMVACKVLLDANGKRMEVMCRSTLIHFDTMSLLQTFFWRQ